MCFCVVIILSDFLKEIINEKFISFRFGSDSARGAVKIIDDIIDNAFKKDGHIFDAEFLQRLRKEADNIMDSGYTLAKASVLVPCGIFGITHGFAYPDYDISLLGIGNHRFFLFHSAIGLAVLRYFYRGWAERLKNPDDWSKRVPKKLVGALLGTFAVGVGLHLAVDLFQPKSINFPFFGSLVDGTMVDDNIWLLGNSLWAFYIAKDVFALAFSSELETAKAFVREYFAEVDACSFQKKM